MSKPSTGPSDKAETACSARSIAHAGRVARRRRPSAAAAPAVASSRTDLHDAEALAPELRVHQIGLESQNEALRNAQLDLAAARDRFIDLCDFAPVGHLTLDHDGRITELNLSCAALLGAPRKSLIGRHFSGFVTAADLRRWRRHLLIALQHDEGRRLELARQSRSGPPLYAQLDGLPVAQAVGGAMLRVTLTDVSQRRLAEMDRRFASTVVEARESERRHELHELHELHEQLGQRLSAIKMDLASLPEVSGAQTPRLQAMLTALGQAVATVRRISTDLRPAMLDDLGLNAAIEGLAQESAQRLGLTVTLRLGDCDPPLGERTAVALHHLIQVVPAHIDRHAHASHVGIELQQGPGDLLLNNGSGWPLQPGGSGTAGSDSTQARHEQARMLGGPLEPAPVAGGGQRFTLHLPLPRETVLPDRIARSGAA